jgi:hypothetical protein
VFQTPPEVTTDAVAEALCVGYRHIDTSTSLTSSSPARRRPRSTRSTRAPMADPEPDSITLENSGMAIPEA